MPVPAARARATKSASVFLNVTSAMAGTLEGKTRAAVPDGEMSSVDTLSPSLISTGARSVASTGRPRGTSLMLGPRTTVTAAASLSGDGGSSPALEAVGVAGGGGGGGGPRGGGGGGSPRGRARDAARRRGQRRAEVDLVVLDAAPPREVTIERAEAPASRGGHVADPGARATRGLGHRRSRDEEIGEQALARHDLEDPAAPREHDQVHAGSD